MITRIVALLFVLAVGLSAQELSQPPSPTPTVGSQTRHQQPGTEESESQPPQKTGSGVIITNAPIIQFPAANSDQGGHDNTDEPIDRWPAWVAAIGTVVIALLTLALAYVGWKQRETYEATLNAHKITERAYVSMSHVPPGLAFVDNPTGHPHDARVTIRITNSGHTPADLIAHDTYLVFGQLVPNPNRPPVPTNPPTSIVMPNDHGDIWLNFAISPERRTAVQAGHPVAVVGWVVYQDRFGKKHRSGYGRQYIKQPVPGTENNNLVFVAEPGYNYEEDLD